MRGILMYHSVDPSGSPISIDEAAFKRHIAWLASGRVRVVGFDEIAAVPDDQDAVAITFDDAFRSFGTLAWPLLKQHNLPATLFVVSDHVGGDNRWGGREDAGIPSLPLHTWEELGQLADEGVELGCHSRTHPDMSRGTRAELEDEILKSCTAIEARTGVRTKSFAYPFGRHGSVARDLAREHFDQTCTTSLGVLPRRPEAHLLPRLDAFYYRSKAGADRLKGWGGVVFSSHLRIRALARGLKGTLTGN